MNPDGLDASPRFRRPLPGPDERGAPRDLSARAWRAVLWRTAKEFFDDRLLHVAAALAFFAALSVFPALLALVALLGLIGAPAIELLIENVSAVAPGTARDIALGALRNIRSGETAGETFVVGLGVALWSSSAYVGALIPAANTVWDVEEERGLWKKLLLRVSLTVVLLVLIAAVALSVVLTGPIAERAGSVVGAGDEAVRVWSFAKWPFLALVLMGLMSLLYWAAPNVRHPGWRWLVPGSVLAVVLWIAASLGFSVYVSNFGTYQAVYGSIGGVLVFLIWLWLSNIAVLLGAELSAELERAGAVEAGLVREGEEP